MNWHKRIPSICITSITIVTCVTVSLFALPVFAQDTPPETGTSASPEVRDVFAPEETIFRKSQQPERIRELFDLYLARVEKHRELDRTFRVSKAQFEKLNTLQSLEEAIEDTRAVMISRDEVLITYLELLHASLDDTAGVDVQIKLDTLKRLEDTINDLKEHLAATQQTVDRAGIADRADEFVPLKQEIVSVTGIARAQIVVGTLQNVYDKIVIIYDQVKAEHEVTEVSALKQQQRERAYAEVDRALVNVAVQLEETRLKFSQGGRSPNLDVADELEQVYTGTAQLLSFVEELALDE